MVQHKNEHDVLEGLLVHPIEKPVSLTDLHQQLLERHRPIFISLHLVQVKDVNHQILVSVGRQKSVLDFNRLAFDELNQVQVAGFPIALKEQRELIRLFLQKGEVLLEQNHILFSLQGQGAQFLGHILHRLFRFQALNRIHSFVVFLHIHINQPQSGHCCR